jgi:DMSO/TMAO reductase YedYZ molybdopterin-dependent catalytic subunit
MVGKEVLMQNTAVGLPPGQRRIAQFPRFGVHLSRPAPAVPVDPVIEIRGAVTEPFDVPLANLAALPRRELVADFHCVTGWSAANLRWEGVSFETFYRDVIEPALPSATLVTHVVFGGLDGYRSVALIEDALADGVIIAERLDGRPLDGDHGAPMRLVSPAQYGYMSTKHLCRIDVRIAEPTACRLPLGALLIKSHPRARVWAEERHAFLPTWLVRPVYRSLKLPFLYLCGRRTSQTASLAPRVASGGSA